MTVTVKVLLPATKPVRPATETIAFESVAEAETRTAVVFLAKTTVEPIEAATELMVSEAKVFTEDNGVTNNLAV